MRFDLTQISGDEYERISSGEMTPAMTAAFTADGEADGEAEASASRRVFNWLSGKNRPTAREDIFRIAFALDLTEGQANYLLGLCTDYGIHYRNGRDVI